MAFNDLTDEAAHFYETMKPSIKKLQTIGIKKELLMRNASNIVVMYPSKQDLTPRDINKLYSTRLKGINTLYIHIPNI